MLSTSRWCPAQLLKEGQSVGLKGPKAGVRHSVQDQKHRREICPDPMAPMVRSITARALSEELLKRMEAHVASGETFGSGLFSVSVSLVFGVCMACSPM